LHKGLSCQDTSDEHNNSNSHPAAADRPTSLDILGPTVVDDDDKLEMAAEMEESNDGSTQTDFEYHAYEAILTTLNTLHAQSYKVLEEESRLMVSYFTVDVAVIIPLEIQERFRALKNDVDNFTTRLHSFRRALSTLTANKEAMALMNLTILKEAPWYYNTRLRREMLARHEEVEQLLASYLMEANTFQVKVANLVHQIDNAEAGLRMRLQMAQNKVLGQVRAVTGDKRRRLHVSPCTITSIRLLTRK
jgi:hypothetical protein